MDTFVFPTVQLELGPEIARGSHGAVHKAKLHGVWVCAKVRRGAVDAGRGSVAGTPSFALLCILQLFMWRMECVACGWLGRELRDCLALQRVAGLPTLPCCTRPLSGRL
jgi:hypothetical protein